MNSSAPINDEMTLARCVAAEDLICGDYVAILSEVREYLSCFWSCDGTYRSPETPVRIQWQTTDDGTPWRIKSICLPFIFAKAPTGIGRTFDVRHFQFARLNPDYAEKVCKSLRKSARRAD